VGAHDFVTALPEGYDTDVNKRGGRLSAGQRQLVSFARAFIADPRVLILDEATASLDIPSERLVQHGLQTLLADRTAIIIAHRLSTVEIADRILVMDGGVIVEDGPSLELRKGTGCFATLHKARIASIEKLGFLGEMSWASSSAGSSKKSPFAPGALLRKWPKRNSRGLEPKSQGLSFSPP
jgi:ABC-type transport system involved in cytochrome bd biosynthesis fused ATPase/permease subunit